MSGGRSGARLGAPAIDGRSGHGRPERSLPPFARWERVDPLVGTGPTRSLVARPRTVEECRSTLAWCREAGLTLCPRGGGHSYEDQILNDGHVLLDVGGLDRIVSFDERRREMVVEAGVRIAEVYRRAHGRLFHLPATPSEGAITVAGAIANNVNGKDSWRAGNFGDRVRSLDLLTAAGDVITVDRETEPELLRAVVGGMGMLGIIVQATIGLERIPSPFLETTLRPTPDLGALLGELAAVERESDFAIVWVDVHARGRSLGRSVIHATRWLPHAGADAGASEETVDVALARIGAAAVRARVYHELLARVLSPMLHFQRASVRAFNALYYALGRARAHGAPKRGLFLDFNFGPALWIPPADLLCGPLGYTVQLVVPRSVAASALGELLERCARMPCPPVTAVLRIHRRDDYLLSFSEDGYSLNLEFHPKRRHESAMRRAVAELIDCAAGHGGRVHLAKDGVLTAEQHARLAPDREAFVRMKRTLDPDGVLSSELFRRLFPDACPRSAAPDL